MRAMLKPHPITPSGAIRSIEVDAARAGPRGLELRYLASGDIAGVFVPEMAPVPGRMDGLWRTTCFEAFVRRVGSEDYLEFNLSPSGEWQAYGFDRYRSGAGEADVEPARIAVERHADRLQLSARLEVPVEGDWRLGLSAVIEAADGGVSYWALAHAPGRPDFHHPDCFAVELVAPERS